MKKTRATNSARSSDHPPERVCDVAIVGGSAAGLAAALQLARQLRSVVLVDDGTPRNSAATHMHGYLGHEAAAPSDLLSVGREEVRRHGGEVLTGRVTAVRRLRSGRFVLDLTDGYTLVARRVLAATGLSDELPAIEGLAEHWGRGAVHCPFCHGFEVRGLRLVQVVDHPQGLHQTALFRHLTDQLTVVLHNATDLKQESINSIVASGVDVERSGVRRVLSGSRGDVSGVELTDGRQIDADVIVVAPRFRARADLLASVGVTPTPHATGVGDFLSVDRRGETSVPGIYAAGNVTDPGLQVLPSAAHGSQVGAMIAFDLAEEELRTGVRHSGEQAEWDHRYGRTDSTWSVNPNGTLVQEAVDMSPGRALDVGTGEGADALWLAERGWKVTAVDISGNALARLRAEADRRGLAVNLLRSDANGFTPFGSKPAFDLVSLQYGSFKRTPDQRGLRNLLNAVNVGGTLLVVQHESTARNDPMDVPVQTRMYDEQAYVGVEEIVAALAAEPDAWQIEIHETRPRPLGAESTHHVRDVVLRAIRRAALSTSD